MVAGATSCSRTVHWLDLFSKKVPRKETEEVDALIVSDRKDPKGHTDVERLKWRSDCEGGISLEAFLMNGAERVSSHVGHPSTRVYFFHTIRRSGSFIEKTCTTKVRGSVEA